MVENLDIVRVPYIRFLFKLKVVKHVEQRKLDEHNRTKHNRRDEQGEESHDPRNISACFVYAIVSASFKVHFLTSYMCVKEIVVAHSIPTVIQQRRICRVVTWSKSVIPECCS